jgi:hypothetical protein
MALWFDLLQKVDQGTLVISIFMMGDVGPIRTLMGLLAHFGGKNYHVHMDNFYTSVKVAQMLVS